MPIPTPSRNNITPSRNPRIAKPIFATIKKASPPRSSVKMIPGSFIGRVTNHTRISGIGPSSRITSDTNANAAYTIKIVNGIQNPRYSFNSPLAIAIMLKINKITETILPQTMLFLFFFLTSLTFASIFF